MSFMKTETVVSSSIEAQDLDQSDFINDPDQFRDQLPQPYRFLNKVLNNLIDNAWEIIFNRQRERLREATKYRPPKYECTIYLEVIRVLHFFIHISNSTMN